MKKKCSNCEKSGKKCSNCEKSGKNCGKWCGYTMSNCVDVGYKYFEPIEKEPAMSCDNCGHSDNNCANGIGTCGDGFCIDPYSRENTRRSWKPIEKEPVMETSCDNCVDGNKNTGRIKCPRGNCGFAYGKFRPIKKEPAMKAEDYKMLKHISLSDIMRDGACDKAILYYAKEIFNNLSTVGKTIFEKVSKEHPEWVPWLIENKYIKKIERKPVVGEVWEFAGINKHLILKPVCYGVNKTFGITTNKMSEAIFDDLSQWTNKGTIESFLKEKT